MSNFGYQSNGIPIIGGTPVVFSGENLIICGDTYTPVAVGSGQSISFYASSTSQTNMEAALYTYTSLGNGTFLAGSFSNSVYIAQYASPQWYTMTFTGVPSISIVPYYIVLSIDNPITLYCDIAASHGYGLVGYSFGTFPGTISFSSGSNAQYKFSSYVSYQANAIENFNSMVGEKSLRKKALNIKLSLGLLTAKNYYVLRHLFTIPGKVLTLLFIQPANTLKMWIWRNF